MIHVLCRKTKQPMSKRRIKRPRWRPRRARSLQPARRTTPITERPRPTRCVIIALHCRLSIETLQNHVFFYISTFYFHFVLTVWNTVTIKSHFFTFCNVAALCWTALNYFFPLINLHSIHHNGKAKNKFIKNKKLKLFHCISNHTLIWDSWNLAQEPSYCL